MQYKMLVLDLDDTLLCDDYSISDRNKEMLMKAQEKGVYVVLASGRPTPAMLRYAKELDLEKYGSFIISYNGAIITDLRLQKSIFEQSLSKEQIHALHDFSLANHVDIVTYTADSIISETSSKYIDIEVQLTQMKFNKVDCFKTAVTEPGVKCILLEDPEYLKTVEVKLKQEKPDTSVAISKPFFLEVMAKGIDKAASVARLAEKLGIRQDEIIAVGNAGNDLSMVEYAGLGVWVDNVLPELRSCADVIVASNNNHGVAEVVEKYILN
ncbi:Cof-type HAD-IIB family hydrolase [Labilibaculum sp. K2S]|uniref:Cof-type HAD-IIB family hydrolase n=1 Tax=Labilibaculum sp. K2S TaxID=3056386 RepID=UPI0025A441FE|nr:Cof-type HAD-IIB family hydrolase [Labilibaculum sp. K2S]MDM8160191.1 Cof-type HAD-IIB family hydrolase [Labilibaculum sp. K2S]